jgi:hypothetical protein
MSVAVAHGRTAPCRTATCRTATCRTATCRTATCRTATASEADSGADCQSSRVRSQDRIPSLSWTSSEQPQRDSNPCLHLERIARMTSGDTRWHLMAGQTISATSSDTSRQQASEGSTRDDLPLPAVTEEEIICVEFGKPIELGAERLDVEAGFPPLGRDKGRQGYAHAPSCPPAEDA